MTVVTNPLPGGLTHTFLSPAQVAELIPGLTVKTLAEWRYERRGPRYRKLGRLVVYALDELEEWIEASAKLGEPESR